MQQLHLQPNFNFDAELSQQAQDAGIRITTLNNKEFLAQAREIARGLAKKGQVLGVIISPVISADDVRRETTKLGITPKTSACWGALFKQSEWIFAGGWVKSELINNHGRYIMTWRLG